jgi:hypothetical protein
VARERTASGAGWASGTAATRGALAAATAGGHTSVLGLPFKASVRGSNTLAMSGRNLL